MKKTNKKGFTIVELVIVIAVIAILAAVLIPTFAGVIEKANKNADLQAARNSFTNYYATLTATELEHLDEQVLVYNGTHGYRYVIENGAVVDKPVAAFKAPTGAETVKVEYSYNGTSFESKAFVYETVPATWTPEELETTTNVAKIWTGFLPAQTAGTNPETIPNLYILTTYTNAKETSAVAD